MKDVDNKFKHIIKLIKKKYFLYLLIVFVYIYIYLLTSM